MIAAPDLARLAAVGGRHQVVSDQQACRLLAGVLDAVRPRRVLLLPPDFTRCHSGVGPLTTFIKGYLSGAQVDILPALGTHAPMSRHQIALMFPGLEPADVLVHDWRRDPVRLGVVPAQFVRQVSGGRLDYEIEIAVNRRVVEGGYDLILSLGQVVPHEVAGMANGAKNLFVGVGGADIINKTHFLGAVCGLEQAMGRAATPVRAVFDYAAAQFCRDLPICYALTVRQRLADGDLVTRGLFVGNDAQTFGQAVALSQEVNLDLLPEPLPNVVVWLDPEEYHSTWLGNKAVYRTRLALADGGRLLVLAPGVARFGEDPTIDALIRRHGYRGTPATLAAVESDLELAANLSAAAHLIHGSSEGRFEITYAPGGLSRAEVESVGYGYGDLATLSARYDPRRLRDGLNRLDDGEEVFFIANPALGLWALAQTFDSTPV